MPREPSGIASLHQERPFPSAARGSRPPRPVRLDSGPAGESGLSGGKDLAEAGRGLRRPDAASRSRRGSVAFHRAAFSPRGDVHPSPSRQRIQRRPMRLDLDSVRGRLLLGDALLGLSREGFETLLHLWRDVAPDHLGRPRREHLDEPIVMSGRAMSTSADEPRGRRSLISSVCSSCFSRALPAWCAPSSPSSSAMSACIGPTRLPIRYPVIPPASEILPAMSPSRTAVSWSSAKVARIEKRPKYGRWTTPTSCNHASRCASALTTSLSASSAPSPALNVKMQTSMSTSAASVVLVVAPSCCALVDPGVGMRGMRDGCSSHATRRFGPDAQWHGPATAGRARTAASRPGPSQLRVTPPLATYDLRPIDLPLVLVSPRP